MGRERTCNSAPVASRIHFYLEEGEAEGMGEEVAICPSGTCRKAPAPPGGALQAWLGFCLPRTVSLHAHLQKVHTRPGEHLTKHMSVLAQSFSKRPATIRVTTSPPGFRGRSDGSHPGTYVSLRGVTVGAGRPHLRAPGGSGRREGSQLSPAAAEVIVPSGVSPTSWALLSTLFSLERSLPLSVHGAASRFMSQNAGSVAASGAATTAFEKGL